MADITSIFPGGFIAVKFSQAVPVDIPAIAALALNHAEQLLFQWFPAGKKTGREFVIGNLRGDPGESLSINVNSGEWSDFASGDKGGDLVSLYAAIHRMPQSGAARELGDELGADLFATPVVSRPVETWEPMVPPPTDVAHPKLAGTVHVYRDADGNPTHYVERVEAKAGARKQFYPWTYGVLNGVPGWHRKHVGTPRPLYGLDRLAGRPGAPVVLCEGEKSADAVASLLPAYVCVTWPGGTNAVAMADFAPLAGRDVIIWPDNDKAGLKAAAEVSARVPGARILRVDDLPQGGDAADVGPLDAPDEWLKARLPGGPATAEADGQPWRVLDVAALKGKPVPVRQWIVPGWIPSKLVTLVYADGGVGKTLLSLQLMAACASGGQWCGLSVAPCKSVGLFSEDDSDELHARIDSIRQHYRLSMDDMAGMHPVDGTGQDNTLCRFERNGKMILTPRFHRLREYALDIGARLIAIDTAATAFGGNENDRGQVTAFVGGALTSLAQDIGGAVVLNTHPSVSGIASGDLRSGSTGWNNSCRSRLTMARPVDDAGKPLLGSDERIVTRRKANAASAGDCFTVQWEDGVFKRPSGDASTGDRKEQAEAAFLAGLAAHRAKGLHLSNNHLSGKTYAPRILAKTPQGRDFKAPELREAMDNLLKRGVIETASYRHDYKDGEELVIV